MNLTRKMAYYIVSDMVNGMDFAQVLEKHDVTKLEHDIKHMAESKGMKLNEHSCWDTLVCYLMAVSDYPVALDSEERRLMWVTEYLSDVDGESGSLFKKYFLD